MMLKRGEYEVQFEELHTVCYLKPGFSLTYFRMLDVSDSNKTFWNTS